MATVLIVEDEILVREIIQTELEEAGYHVVVANNADAAVAILEARGDIHLVFTDIDMVQGRTKTGRLRSRSLATHPYNHYDGEGPAIEDPDQLYLYTEALSWTNRCRRHPDVSICNATSGLQNHAPRDWQNEQAARPP